LQEGCESSPKLCLENCKKDDGNACYSLALLLEDKIRIEVEESSPLFLRSGKLGIISGCTNRAAYKMDLDSTDEKSSKCSADTFEKTCVMEDPWGCSMYGIMLAYGHGREKNFDEALKFLQKACKIDSDLESEACKGANNIKAQIEQFQKKVKK
jgi:hypothetical protein